MTPMDQNRSSQRPSEIPSTERAETADPRPPGANARQLQVNVLYTTHDGTLAALKIAARLSTNLGTCPKVLRLYAVPYTLPLEKPTVPTYFLEEQIRALACESPTEFTARIYLCREPRWTLRELFPPHSVIVIAGKKRWWPTKEQWWARLLRKEGHEVIFVNPE